MLTISEVTSRFGVGVANMVLWLKKPDSEPSGIKPRTKIDMEALARDDPDAYQVVI